MPMQLQLQIKGIESLTLKQDGSRRSGHAGQLWGVSAVPLVAARPAHNGTCGRHLRATVSRRRHLGATPVEQ
ncbi:hypothetical protein E4U43_003277 [Claviceps pusilla]|uniref:Uncharacterized protein n=1 Tax=Claviceps pusilla TaxID=123648 RepID=A0A9P7N501_9HYPO|nr:hypothetical protein E4U43_003277 [Claviceps pusilla]